MISVVLWSVQMERSQNTTLNRQKTWSVFIKGPSQLYIKSCLVSPGDKTSRRGACVKIRRDVYLWSVLFSIPQGMQ